MTDTEARTVCTTPDKVRYATLVAADSDRIKLYNTVGRRLVAYDSCPCGWVHLAKEDPNALFQAKPLTLEEITLLDHEQFNLLVREEVRGRVRPETAENLRHASLYRAWVTSLKLFQTDLNYQKHQKAGDRSPDVVAWRSRVDSIILATSKRVAEANHIAALGEQKKAIRKREQVGVLDVVLHSDEELDLKILKRMAGELAAEKIKNRHLDEYIHLCALEYQRFGLPLTKAMEIALEHYGIPKQRTDPEEGDQ